MTMTLFLAVFLLPLVSSCITQEEKGSLLDLKTSTYGVLPPLGLPGILSGQCNPLEICDWKNTVFVNWEIRLEKISSLENKLGLAEEMHIASIPIIQGEEPKPYLSYAMKKVDIPGESNAQETIQGDWLVYVTTDDDPEPTLMVIESNYNFETTSPMGKIPSSDITFKVTSDDITVNVSSKDTRLAVSVTKSTTTSASLDDIFLASFDKLYWPNGVYSILASNGSLLLAKVQAEEKEQTQGWTVELGKSQWSQHVEPDPQNVMYFTQPIELGAEVWVNMEDLARSERWRILKARNGIYWQRTLDKTSLIQSSEWQPIINFQVSQNVPAYNMNFRIREDKVEELTKFVSLPDDLELAKIQFRENGSEHYILTLNVYEVNGIGGLVSGFRLEWNTFVKESGSEQPLFIILEANFSGSTLDPVKGLQLEGATRFDLGLVGSNVVTVVEQDDTEVDVSFPLPSPCEPYEQSDSCDLPSLSFVASNSRVYYANGVYDLARWDGNTWRVEPFAIVDPKTVKLNVFESVWNQFIDPEVYEVVVWMEQQKYLITPWANAEEIPVC